MVVSTVKILKTLVDKRDLDRVSSAHCQNLVYLFQICGADLGYRMQWYNKAWSPDLAEDLQDYRHSKPTFDKQIEGTKILPKGQRVLYATKMLLHSTKYTKERWAHILVNTHYSKHILWTGKPKTRKYTTEVLTEYTDITAEEVKDAWKRLRTMGLIDTIAYGKR